MTRASRQTGRRSRGAADLVLVVALTAAVIGLSAVAAGLGAIDAVPIPTPFIAARGAERRVLDAPTIPALALPVGTPAAARQAFGRGEHLLTPAPVANGEAFPIESEGDPRRDLMELGTANRQRGVTRHQAAIGHAYAP